MASLTGAKTKTTASTLKSSRTCSVPISFPLPTFTRRRSGPCAPSRQCIFYIWCRSELLARIHSHQLAHNRIPAKQSRWTRDPWEEQLLMLKNQTVFDPERLVVALARN